MKTSKLGIELIKHFESLHDGDLSEIGLQPKMCPAGIWTEGYGHAIYNGKNTVKGSENKSFAESLSVVKNEADAEKLLKADLIRYEMIVNNNVKVNLTQNQFDALVSHAYNTGGSETLFELINSGAMIMNSDKIKNWWLGKYTTANGKYLEGLAKRRRSEWCLFETGKLNFNA